MTSAMMKESIQEANRIPPHDAHPIIVCSFRCFESLKARKKMNLPVTEAYKQPTKMMVGIMKE